MDDLNGALGSPREPEGGGGAFRMLCYIPELSLEEGLELDGQRGQRPGMRGEARDELGLCLGSWQDLEMVGLG